MWNTLLSIARQGPTEPLGHAAPHDLLLILVGKAVEFLREKGHRLAVGAGESRRVCPPEHTPGP
jgi:hypothetical protein